MHAFLHKSRRGNHRWVVFTQQDMIYSRAHLVLTKLLITSLLVLCFSQRFLLFLPPEFLLISCCPLDSYSNICLLGTDELIVFFDLSISLSEKAFTSTCMHLYTKVGEKITGGWCLHSRRRFTRAHT